jgi:hypothetical protein
MVRGLMGLEYAEWRDLEALGEPDADKAAESPSLKKAR